MNYSSKLLEKAVEEFAKLPGIGKKTALRLVLNLLNREVDDVTRFATAITSLREEIRFCKNVITFLISKSANYALILIEIILSYVLLKTYAMLWLLKTHNNTEDFITF